MKIQKMIRSSNQLTFCIQSPTIYLLNSHNFCTNKTSTNLPTSTSKTTKPAEVPVPNKLQKHQPTKMVPMKPIGLREMIEFAEIAAMKREKDETLPDCYHSDRFGYGLPKPKPTTSVEVERRLLKVFYGEDRRKEFLHTIRGGRLHWDLAIHEGREAHQMICALQAEFEDVWFHEAEMRTFKHFHDMHNFICDELNIPIERRTIRQLKAERRRSMEQEEAKGKGGNEQKTDGADEEEEEDPFKMLMEK